jgi:hypothetical protein
MKSQVYGIFDQCSGIYEKPFFSTSDDLVKREFQDIVVAADHPISKHPEHYSLWRLGNFDNTTGLINNETNECLWTGTEAKSQSQSVDRKQMDLLNGQIESIEYPAGLTD